MSNSKLAAEKEHPDITYLKQDEIGLVVSRALKETYKADPSNPIDYFAKYLLNYARTERKAKKVRNPNEKEECNC